MLRTLGAYVLEGLGKLARLLSGSQVGVVRATEGCITRFETW